MMDESFTLTRSRRRLHFWKAWFADLRICRWLNKRTAITFAGLLLGMKHWLTATNPELETFTLQFAQGLISLRSIVLWFKNHAMQPRIEIRR